MNKGPAIATMVGLLAITGAMGQIPPGYEIVTIDPDPTFNYTARMNNHGQIVYSLWTNGGEDDGLEIMLYDSGELIRLTDDDVFDRTPDINDAGQIVWCRATDGPGSPTQIVLWEDGDLTQLTFSPQDDRSPRINNLGHVAWKRYMGEGCGGQRMDVFFYDGESIQRITTNGETDNLANQHVVVNDDDQIVWTEYNFCDNPWTSKIMMWSDGGVTQLSPGDVWEPRAPKINNLGQVAWIFQSDWGEHGIQLWEDGEVTTITDWGNVAGLNNHGDMAVYRFYEAGPVGAYEVWLYRNGQFLQITEDPHDQGWTNIWNLPTDINELGEIVYMHGRPWYYETVVKCMKLRLASGGCAGKIDAVNVEPIDP